MGCLPQIVFLNSDRYCAKGSGLPCARIQAGCDGAGDVTHSCEGAHVAHRLNQPHPLLVQPLDALPDGALQRNTAAALLGASGGWCFAPSRE